MSTITKITPVQNIFTIRPKELWQHRNLFFMLCWRNIAVRYKQTALGILWVILQPLATVVIFSLIFSKMVNADSLDGMPYPLFLSIGVVFWQLFSTAIINATNSMIEDVELIKKVYFPRIFIPCAAISAAILDFLIISFLLMFIVQFYGYVISLKFLFFYLMLTVLTVTISLGYGLFLAGMNVKYRDVRYALPFFIQLLFFVTPIIYPVQIFNDHSLVKDILLCVNPIASVITIARGALFDCFSVSLGFFCQTVFFSLFFFVLGLSYFRKVESYFADII